MKQRTSHYVAISQIDYESQKAIKSEICKRVNEKLVNRRQKQHKNRALTVVKVHREAKATAFKIPERTEATYAAKTDKKQSEVIQNEILAKAKQFREVIQKAAKKKKIRIHPVNWQSRQHGEK